MYLDAADAMSRFVVSTRPSFQIIKNRCHYLALGLSHALIFDNNN